MALVQRSRVTVPVHRLNVRSGKPLFEDLPSGEFRPFLSRSIANPIQSEE